MGLICSGHHCFLKVIAAAARTPPGAWVPAAAARTSPPSGESCGEKRGLLLNLNAVCRLQRPRPEGSRGPARLGTFSRHGWLSSGGGSLGCARRRLLTLGDKVAGDLPPPGQVGAFPRDRCCGALWPKAPRWAGPRWAVRRRVGDTWRGCLRVHLCWRVQCQVTGSPRGGSAPTRQPAPVLPPTGNLAPGRRGRLLFLVSPHTDPRSGGMGPRGGNIVTALDAFCRLAFWKTVPATPPGVWHEASSLGQDGSQR